MALRHLLVTPCDPGNCHIYFGVQLRAFPTALALAYLTGRTLILPPFEYYEGQAQKFTNAFKATSAGQRPLFIPWSELYDIDRLRRGGVDVVDFHEVAFDTLDVALLQTGITGGPAASAAVAEEAKARGSLAGVLDEKPCRPSRPSSEGLRANMTFAADDAARSLHLYGRQLALGTFACGTMSLQQDREVQVLTSWFGEARVAAAFNVGHHLHARVGSAAHARASDILANQLYPSPPLQREAERFIRDALQDALQPPSAGSSHTGAASAATEAGRPRFVAAHWRHGDYVPYKLGFSAEQVAAQVNKALERAGCVPASSCRIFLMTNCRDERALAELAAQLPTPPVRYAPSDATFAHEGRRLVVEQAIARKAAEFVASPRSAVSDFIGQMRRARPVSQPSAPKVEL